MSWAAVRPVSPVDHHDLVPCVVHIPSGVGIVAAIVGVCAVVARWDVIPTGVAVVVRVVVVRADGGCSGRHSLLLRRRCNYVDDIVEVLSESQIDLSTDVVKLYGSWQDEGLAFGLRRISWPFYHFGLPPHHPIAADA